ncbi:hypothetical protein BR63_04345 [Thermanaerosceptrum fracticalcis]|uniref:Uncharacterized protein n=1 Tax=Thermanaerosceptrum fracticalcis TaxID=1712410 RepID=A0A7G6E0L0_THEFR|nr:hypothetical protein [Thermanaerosceptrum fracticalcis]QNB45614.1 hypothetical protein BR63_04345 [Thermanaerosceptrum fracticalcis]
MVVSKFGPGFATCTTVSNTSFRNSGSQFSKEEHHFLTLQTGQGLNESELVDALVELWGKDVKDFKKMEVPIEEKYGGSYCQGKLPFFRGPTIMKTLAEYAKNINIGVDLRQPYFV